MNDENSSMLGGALFQRITNCHLKASRNDLLLTVSEVMPSKTQVLHLEEKPDVFINMKNQHILQDCTSSSFHFPDTGNLNQK